MNLLQLHEPGETPLPHADEDSAAVGIDLGTTHSVVAYSHAGAVEVLRNTHGHALIPSVVSYAGDEPVVGHPAREARAKGETLAVASIKRLMGRGAGDLRPLMGAPPFTLVPDEGGPLRLAIGEHRLTPAEISADILKHLKALAERALGREVRQAVITVPAYFDDAARTATRDAARLAGFNVLRLVNEPTAAALAYGLDKGAQGVYAVYDLGGGTFDISLLKLEKGIFQVLSTAGDTALGGDDMDHALAEHVGRRLGLAGLSAAESGQMLARCRAAREDLSDTPAASVEWQGQHVSITREEMNGLTAPLIERTLRICAQALEDAQAGPEDIRGVILVGGVTRMPQVRERVAAFFAQTPLTDVNPDEVVAVGAALQAENLTHGSGMLLLDVLPLSLGLETMGGLAEKLLPRNTPIPASVSQEFTTWQDGQTGMQFHIVQGEREMAAQNRSLAQFSLTGIPPLPAGIARVRVTFTVDADGLLTVSAGEKTTGVSQRVEIKPSYGLEPEQVERMLLESMAHARADIADRLLTEARVEAERAVQEVLSAMKADGNLLSQPERALIEHQIGYVREALADEDRDRIDAEAQQLAHATADFAQRRMDRAIAAALKGTHIDAAGT